LRQPETNKHVALDNSVTGLTASLPMKLSDGPWEPETNLGRLGLEGQDLASHEAFWDRSAQVDAIRSIADQHTKGSFDASGVADAEPLAPFLSPDAAFLEIGCGIGPVLQHVAPMCREVPGIDISGEMVKRVRSAWPTSPTSTCGTATATT
jgi:hypothetical protein